MQMWSSEGFISTPPLKALADLLGVKTIVIGAGIAAFALGFLLFGVGGSLVCNLVGFVYPALDGDVQSPGKLGS